MTACEGLIPSDCNNPDCPAHAADRDDLAAIIEAHEVSMDYESYRGCACSPAPYPKAPAISQQDHAAHVAQMVLESDWLRERATAKWAEGRNAGVTDMTRVIGWGVGGCKPDQMPSDTPNPYRADRVDAEATDNTTDRT